MNKIHVMIIDDSALIRNLVTRMLSDHPHIEVVGTAINGKFGLAKLDRIKPDVIILDLEMPEMNGIEFLKERKNLNIKIPVIILSSIAKKGAQITLEALSLGASDFVLKPSDHGQDISETKDILIEMIVGLGCLEHHEPICSHHISSLQPAQVEKPVKNDINSYPVSNSAQGPVKLAEIKYIPEIDIVTVAISTGGPNALREMLPEFQADFPAPIVIVQHMPAGFTAEFANSLNKICDLEVKEAEDGDIVSKGRILIAPGGKHIRFEKKALATVIKVDDDDPVNGHKPSCDVLFESTALIYGSRSLGCIMTGMGKDGADKIGDILKAGGITIAQDQASSVVYGMPNVATRYGNIQIVKPLSELAKTIIGIVLEKRVC